MAGLGGYVTYMGWEGFLSFVLCLCSYLGKGEVRVLSKKQFDGGVVGDGSVMPIGYSSPLSGSLISLMPVDESVMCVDGLCVGEGVSSSVDNEGVVVVDKGVDNVVGERLSVWGRFRLMFDEGRGIGSSMSFGGFVILCVEIVLGVGLFVMFAIVGDV